MGLNPNSIDSLEALELLLLLRRSPDTYWTAEAASQQLGINREVASRKLLLLMEAGLVVRGRDTGAYRFCPGSDEARTLQDRLRAFSDAFRLKNE